MQICFLIKRKKEHQQIYSQAYISMVLYFGDKPTSLQRNGMAAIPKMMSHADKIFCCFDKRQEIQLSFNKYSSTAGILVPYARNLD